MPTERKYNIALIAGYDVFADEIKSHRNYVAESYSFACQMGAEIIFTLGGATNPDRLDLTEAQANAKILCQIGCSKDMIVEIPEGNTPEESIHAAMRELKKNGIQAKKIIICTETASLTGFMMDALQKEFLDLGAEGIYVYGHRFPESGEIFPRQRKKILLRALSYKWEPFRLLRLFLHDRHQKKMAKRKREEKQ